MYMGIAQSRRSKRKSVLMMAVVIGADGAHDATIKNISAKGAQLSARHVPPIGGDVIFKRGDMFAAARVAWADGASFGIEFYRPLDPA